MLTPYYDQDGITIYHGDCREVLADLPPVQLVLTDPPYSERTHQGARTNRNGGGKLIDFPSISLSDLRNVFELCAAQLDGWLISFCDWRYILPLSEEPPAGLRFVRFGCWVKVNGAPQLSGDRPAMGWEALALMHTTNRRSSWNGGGHRAVWSYLKENRVQHPTQKPLALVKQLASLFSTSGDTILDPFMGSGTTLVAARDCDCRAIGIELEEKYCEVAVNRLSQRVFRWDQEAAS